MDQMSNSSMCMACKSLFVARYAGTTHEAIGSGFCKGEIVAMTEVPVALLPKPSEGARFDRHVLAAQYRGIPSKPVLPDPVPGIPRDWNPYGFSKKDEERLLRHLAFGRACDSLRDDPDQLPVSDVPGVVEAALRTRITLLLEKMAAECRDLQVPFSEALVRRIVAAYKVRGVQRAHQFYRMLVILVDDTESMLSLAPLLASEFPAPDKAAAARATTLNEKARFEKMIADGDLIADSRWFLATWVNPNWQKRAELLDLRIPNAMVLPFGDIYGGYVRLPVFDLAPMEEEDWPRSCRAIRFPDGTRQPTALRRDAHGLPFMLNPAIEETAPMVFGNLKLDKPVPLAAVKSELFRQEAKIEDARKAKAGSFLDTLRRARTAPQPTPKPIRVDSFSKLGELLERFPRE